MNAEVNSGGTPEVNSEITTEANPEVNPDTLESEQFQERVHMTKRNKNKLKWNMTIDDLPNDAKTTNSIHEDVEPNTLKNPTSTSDDIITSLNLLEKRAIKLINVLNDILIYSIYYQSYLIYKMG